MAAHLKPERFSGEEYAEQTIALCGQRLTGHRSGALYWDAQDVLIVSDLHLEKGSARAHRGALLPPYDTRETLLNLAEVIEHFEPATVISLGDSFHDRNGYARMSDTDRQILAMLQDDRDWVWVTGNHDPELSDEAGGVVVDQMKIGPLTLRHEPQPARATHEIAGHLHPAAKLSMYGASLRRPCFVSNGLRLVMPAFGAFTGGLNVLDVAFEPLFGNDGLAIWMRGDDGLYPVAARQLRCDGATTMRPARS
ncbi:MAG: ligase-associated DNA damage response endonuclease PdeM [Pseudomonadota bacterium]